MEQRWSAHCPPHMPRPAAYSTPQPENWAEPCSRRTPKIASQIDEIIFSELILGSVTNGGLQVLREAVAALAGDGAELVILGNSDMALAVEQLRADAPIPVIDSARAHARAAAHTALHGMGRAGLAAPGGR